MSEYDSLDTELRDTEQWLQQWEHFLFSVLCQRGSFWPWMTALPAWPRKGAKSSDSANKTHSNWGNVSKLRGEKKRLVQELKE